MRPLSRGARMVEAAQRPLRDVPPLVRGAAAVPVAAAVVLSPPVAGLSTVPSWEEVARDQGDVDEDVLRKAVIGSFFALDDRNVVSMQTWRRVFAICDGNDFVLYDAQGRLIDEPSDGVVGGRQDKETLVEEFSATGFFFYRPGKVRPQPALQRRHHVLDRQEPQPVADNLAGV